MKLGSFRRLYSSDFKPEYKELIDQIGTTYNPNIESIYDALNKKLSFADNIASTIVTFNVTVNSDGTPTRKTQVKLDNSQLNTPVLGAIVLQAVGSRDTTLLPTAGVYVSVSKNESSLIIQNIKGLQADSPYNVTILVI